MTTTNKLLRETEQIEDLALASFDFENGTYESTCMNPILVLNLETEEFSESSSLYELKENEFSVGEFEDSIYSIVGDAGELSESVYVTNYEAVECVIEWNDELNRNDSQDLVFE